MEKTLYIRADMNGTIATGHVMRCLSVADAAKEMGINTIFIAADREPVELLVGRGYETIVLGTNWQDMESELWAMETLIKDRQITQLLVDSYQVTENYLARLSGLTEVYFLDDVNAFPAPVHAVINYNCYGEEMGYEGNSDYYLGCAYTPLRKMFLGCTKKDISEQAEHLLIMSGGTDQCNMLEEITGAIVEQGHRPYRDITVICGRYYKEIDKLQRYAQTHSGADMRITVLPSVENMRDYLEKADILISAGGTTLYEVCAVGTPTISFAFADNQMRNVEWFHRKGYIACAGDARTGEVPGNVLRLLQEYESVEERSIRSKKMQALVDGRGAGRIAAIVMNKKVER